MMGNTLRGDWSRQGYGNGRMHAIPLSGAGASGGPQQPELQGAAPRRGVDAQVLVARLRLRRHRGRAGLGAPDVGRASPDRGSSTSWRPTSTRTGSRGMCSGGTSPPISRTSPPARGRIRAPCAGSAGATSTSWPRSPAPDRISCCGAPMPRRTPWSWSKARRRRRRWRRRT